MGGWGLRNTYMGFPLEKWTRKGLGLRLRLEGLKMKQSAIERPENEMLARWECEAELIENGLGAGEPRNES